ncbi:MAG TPA: aspartate-semialdehyde dehydrogenase [Vicinamibacterales bacterium]|nr:aspartate-semialdehyde dehydrogenase [Vicinamibacterales bacterium]
MTAVIEVGVLGATGMVGQQFIRLLDGHPLFRPTWLAASERSEGRLYREAATWRLGGNVPAMTDGRRVEACTPGQGPRLLFSALDAAAAADLEPAFAAAGHIVVSNARSFRMQDDVPLLIPEINPDHLGLIEVQRRARCWRGAIVTNPNCSTVVLAMALAPLRPFGIRTVLTTTLQAVSGAGYPGVPSYDIVANVIPGIGGGEEEKIETEANKILGSFAEGRVTAHPAIVSAHTNRVPVVDGHTLTVSVALDSAPSVDEVARAMREWRGRPQELRLPSAPELPIEVLDEPFRPQPRLDAGRGAGMTVSVGRIRPCAVSGIKFVALGHNTVRGAAGAAILNAELMHAEGWLEDR